MNSSSPGRRLIRAAGLAIAGLLVATASASADEGQILRENAANAVPGNYIVVLDDAELDGTPQGEITALAREYDADVEHRYTSAVRGFSAEMTREEALELSTDPAVAYVEQDRTFTIQATQSPTPSWGLDRIDQRDLPLDNSFTYPNTASGVTAYVIDTGIRTTHSAFGGRATWGTNTTGDGNDSDCNGHGTHVAGTIGGATHGVAKGVKLVAVKVLDCGGSGAFSGVMAGIDWVTNNHSAGQPAVANMSLGAAGADAGVETAIRNSITDGIVYSIAAGNSNANACNFTPARVAEAITVNSSTSTDARSSFSNYGTCTDIFAPGSDITSAWNTNDTATNTISGTSMAAPHVAGAAALILGTTPNATPAAVADTLIANATLNKVTNPGTGSPNRLLSTGAPVPPNPTPTPTPTPTPPAGNCTSLTNDTDFPIADLTTVESPIAVAGCAGNASATSQVEVHLVHSYRGDLVVSLIAPDGTAYNLHNRSGGSADNLDQTFTVNLSSEPLNGTWKLRVQDAANGDTGSINTWTLKASAPPVSTCSPAPNTTDVAIADNASVESPITVAGCVGNATATATVDVDIVHTYVGDLVVDLLAPDGSVYNLRNRSGGSADNVKQTFTVNLSTETANGTWKLRVRDAASSDVGYINAWAIHP